MPFPNEHAARQVSPAGFDSFRRDNSPKGAPAGVSFIFGIKAGKSTLQSVRFDHTKWTPAKAKKWLRDHKLKTAGFEEATKSAAIQKGLWSGVL